MIEFSVESFIENREELEPLFVQHYHEIAMYQDYIDLDVDYDRYKEAEDAGKLVTIIARDEGEIVGYSVYIINSHLHYKSDLFAINDIVYLDKDYRRSNGEGVSAGKEMLEFADKHLKSLGVSVISLHMKTFAAFEGLAKSLGYDKAEYIYTKCVKGEQ